LHRAPLAHGVEHFLGGLTPLGRGRLAVEHGLQLLDRQALEVGRLVGLDDALAPPAVFPLQRRVERRLQQPRGLPPELRRRPDL
jgi:hypothetical protein